MPSRGSDRLIQRALDLLGGFQETSNSSEGLPPADRPILILSVNVPLQIRHRNLQPALQWVSQNRVKLKDASGEAAASLFEYKLHQLCFLEVLHKDGVPLSVTQSTIS